MITKNDLLIFDTSSLLDLYRHSIINSKRILNYIKEYEDIIWIPEQVKKEFIRNRDKAKNINMYKNFKKSTGQESEKLKAKLLKYINGYSKSGFSNLSELEGKIKNKFVEINDVIDDYNNSIKEESEIYKDYILNEVDGFLESLLNGDKVGQPFNIVEIMDILKEGELRYRYNIAPGFEDEKNKSGIDKFGDLIIWKEIIRKSMVADSKTVYFVTSDNKPDWFKLGNDKKLEACKELIEEFNYYIKNKEIKIITMSNFIELISNHTEVSDKKLLIELRKEIVVNNIGNDIINNAIEKKLMEHELEILNYLPTNCPKGSEAESMEIEKLNLANTNLIFEDNTITYRLNVDFFTSSHVIVNNVYTVEHGTLYFKGNLDVNIVRDLQVEEKEFIDNLKINPDKMITIDNIAVEENEYVCLENEDIEANLNEEVYSTCPICGEGISFSNDAGNSYCIECTSKLDI